MDTSSGLRFGESAIVFVCASALKKIYWKSLKKI